MAMTFSSFYCSYKEWALLNFDDDGMKKVALFLRGQI
jgi:hypothetical protein